MVFHEDPDNLESPTLGPLLAAEHHLKDPLDPTLKYTCCSVAEQNGTLDTHDCDRHYIYFVRRVVSNRYIEYMKSGAAVVRNAGTEIGMPSHDSVTYLTVHLHPTVESNCGLRQTS